jgi:hypothetical protein
MTEEERGNLILVVLWLLFFIIMIFASTSRAISAPDLSQRNYYPDEIVFSNPCFKAHGVAYPWSVDCQDKGILKTDYGATLAENITLFTYEGEFENKTGRINGVLKQSGFITFASVTSKNYSLSDAIKYADRVYNTINTMQQYQCLTKKSNCLSLEVSEVRLPTENLICGIHNSFPYVRVQETQSGWCFVQP